MKNTKINRLIVFLIGALSLVNLSILGLVSVSEMIMTITFPILLIYNANKYKAFNKNEIQTVIMIFIWAAGIVICDLINHTPINLFFKGIGHPIMILFSFIFLSRIMQYSRFFIKYFIYGLGIASILSYFTKQIAQDNFRFGIFFIIISFSFIVIYYLWERRNFKICFAILVILTLIGFIGGGRSDGLILFLTIILLVISFILYKKNQNLEYKIITKTLLTIILLVLGIQEAYIFAVKNKVFSSEYQTKFEEQLNTGLPLIFSGRAEIFSSLEAIKDSPLIGHGSWKKDSKYTNIYYQKQGIDIAIFDGGSKIYGFDKIPAHSFFFGSWVEHGILAALFFLFFGKILMNVLILAINSFQEASTPYLIFLFLSYSWHLLFSPLGSDKRIFIGLILALNSFYLNSISKYNKTNVNNRSIAIPNF